ncbi:MAG: PDZ domain-containing protein, partial [Clostridia bacterium]|nr:PDZ domain-containing protein [Clostridia bacterium]
MKKPTMLRRSAGVVAAFLLAMSWFSPMQRTLRDTPDTLALTRAQLEEMRLGPLTLEGEVVSATASEDETLAEAASAEMWLSLLGVPLKKVDVHVSPEKRLVPGGQALGIAMRTEGVLIVGVSEAAEGVAPARSAGLQAGDVIVGVDGSTVTTAESLTTLLEKSAGKPV